MTEPRRVFAIRPGCLTGAATYSWRRSRAVVRPAGEQINPSGYDPDVFRQEWNAARGSHRQRAPTAFVIVTGGKVMRKPPARKRRHLDETSSPKKLFRQQGKLLLTGNLFQPAAHCSIFEAIARGIRRIAIDLHVGLRMAQRRLGTLQLSPSALRAGHVPDLWTRCPSFARAAAQPPCAWPSLALGGCLG